MGSKVSPTLWLGVVALVAACSVPAPAEDPPPGLETPRAPLPGTADEVVRASAPPPRVRPEPTPAEPFELRATGREPLVIALPELAFLETHLVRSGTATPKSAWDLGEIVEQQLGPGARPTAAVDRQGTAHELALGPDRRAMLRVNNRGRWRLLLVDAARERLPDERGVRDVVVVAVQLPEPGAHRSNAPTPETAPR